MTHSYVWHDSFICVTWLIICARRRVHMCHITHSYVWHDSCICVNDSIIHMCDMTPSYVWHDSCVCVNDSIIHMCDMTQSYVWHDSCICVNDSIMHMCGYDSFRCVAWLMHMCEWFMHNTYVSYSRRDTTHAHVRYTSFICVAWLMHMGERLMHMCYTLDVTRRIHNFSSLTWDLTHPHKDTTHPYIHTCDMSHQYIHMCDMSHEYIHMCDRLIHIRDMTHPHKGHGLFICVTWLIVYARHEVFTSFGDLTSNISAPK